MRRKIKISPILGLWSESFCWRERQYSWPPPHHQRAAWFLQKPTSVYGILWHSRQLWEVLIYYIVPDSFSRASPSKKTLAVPKPKVGDLELLVLKKKSVKIIICEWFRFFCVCIDTKNVPKSLCAILSGRNLLVNYSIFLLNSIFGAAFWL